MARGLGAVTAASVRLGERAFFDEFDTTAGTQSDTDVHRGRVATIRTFVVQIAWLGVGMTDAHSCYHNGEFNT